ALGTSLHRSLRIPGESLPGVLPAPEFLRRVRRGDPVPLGRRTLVIGGGDVAMDSVRSALRLSSGGPVTLVYRRGREEMPADPDEIREAEAEGIEFLFYRAPVRIEGSDRVSGLTVRTVNLGPPDPNGRRELVASMGRRPRFPATPSSWRSARSPI
ncbi:glutamate synthase (NADPH), homotetrameric, partial [mine drainage metagenome]